ncbi:trichohyalin-like [Myxocyprinus asiaticus]|uniref:trichohyalin-like n=1 Tax=Myxocyprinus asiaticus TaxID=70543 RepID=UPI002222D9B7|nr:trichohyalin-like [Myxocyprinus asiaticus]
MVAMTPRCMHVYMSNSFCCSGPSPEKTSCGNTFRTIMAKVDHDGSGENTDELLSADVDDAGVDVYGLIPLPLSHDHCDHLLDAIDAQLSRLQTHSHNQMPQGNSKRYEFPSLGNLDRSWSLSNDTGLGSTVPTNDKTASTSDQTPSGKGGQTEHQPVEMIKVGDSVTDVWHPEGNGSLSSVSRKEQCLWRLERLLGRSAEIVGMENIEDSICTEDFSTHFRNEMLDLPGTVPAPDAPMNRSDTADHTQPQRSPHHERSKNHPQHLSKTPVRHLAGIPMQSFDSVTIDTDLETVCSEQVQQHLKSALRNSTGSAFHLKRGNGFCTGQPIKNKIESFSSDDEGTIDEMSGEGAMSTLFYRGSRHTSGRKGKRRSSHQSRRKNSHTSAERPQDKIIIDRDKLRELRLSLAELQQQKTAAVQSLEKLRQEMDQGKREQYSLQLSMRDNRAQAQNIKCELHRLQAQRDLCLEEVKVLQEQQVTLDQRQKAVLNHDISCHNCVSRSVSALEREEMDRLLHNAKSELFSEQRHFRHTLDSMQERLDEVNQELEQREEDCRALRQKRSDLEEQLVYTIREREQIKESSQEELKQQANRFGVLERIVAQKDLLLQGMEEEKKALHLELYSLREEHSLKLSEIKNRTQKDKEEEIEQLTLQLAKSHKEELQMIHQQAEVLRLAALSEQAQTHKQSIDSLQNCIQMKDEEVKRLKETLEQHEENMRRQAEELRGETLEKIGKAVKREERKWEEQREKALREQQGILEEQIEEAAKKGKVEVEKERMNALALQSKLIEIQKEAEKETVCLKKSLQRSEKELQELRAALIEKDQKHQRRTARHEQQSSHWAQDIHTECVCLQELLKHNGLTVESNHLSDRPTMSEAIQTLQSFTKVLQQLINNLKNELSSQRRAALQLSRDKEQESRLQKEQLIEEKEQALAALKDKLIKEHIEEMSSLSRAQLHRGDDDTDGLFACLRRQLQAKDDELRQVVNNMAHWKDKTTARLARKFELELTAELERKAPKPRAEQQKRLERLENEMRQLTGQCGDYRESQLASTALQSDPDFQKSPNTQDLTSYKLLRHLQSRIRQLQAESQTHCTSLGKWDREVRDLGGSYLDTIDPAKESNKTEGCLPASTFPS